MKLSEHQQPVNFEVMRREEMEMILEWLDEQPEAYVNFLMWRQVKDAYNKAEQDWANSQEESYDGFETEEGN